MSSWRCRPGVRREIPQDGRSSTPFRGFAVDRGGNDRVMADIWKWTEAFGGDRDVVGFTVEATDGRVGTVDEATYDAGQGHIAVHTGPWILGRTVVLPAGVIGRIDWDAETVHVDRTRDQIKAA